MHSRRDFLKRASLVALAPVVPTFLARTARAAVPDKDGGLPAAVFVGRGAMPVALRSRRSVASGLTRPEDFVLAPEVKPGRSGLGAEPKDDLLAFVRRSALDGYATAERMAAVVRADDGN